jgi:hypothetical protein
MSSDRGPICTLASHRSYVIAFRLSKCVRSVYESDTSPLSWSASCASSSYSLGLKLTHRSGPVHTRSDESRVYSFSSIAHVSCQQRPRTQVSFHPPYLRFPPKSSRSITTVSPTFENTLFHQRILVRTRLQRFLQVVGTHVLLQLLLRPQDARRGVRVREDVALDELIFVGTGRETLRDGFWSGPADDGLDGSN